MATTANGNVYARIFKPRDARFAFLDRAKGVWQEVIGDPGGPLIGSKGDDLVFSRSDAVSTILTFAPASSLRIKDPER